MTECFEHIINIWILIFMCVCLCMFIAGKWALGHLHSVKQGPPFPDERNSSRKLAAGVGGSSCWCIVWDKSETEDAHLGGMSVIFSSLYWFVTLTFYFIFFFLSPCSHSLTSFMLCQANIQTVVALFLFYYASPFLFSYDVS